MPMGPRRLDPPYASLGGQLPKQHLQTVAELTVDAQSGGGLVAAVDHAGLTARGLAVTIFLPRRIVHEAAKGCVVFIGDEVARAFPSLHVAGGISPRGAGKFALAAEELQVDGRRGEPIFGKEFLGLAEFDPD